MMPTLEPEPVQQQAVVGSFQASNPFTERFNPPLTRLTIARHPSPIPCWCLIPRRRCIRAFSKTAPAPSFPRS